MTYKKKGRKNEEEKMKKKKSIFNKIYTIEKNIKDHLVEWGATFLSVFGAILNANQFIQGFYVWSVANILWIIFGIKYKHYGLVLMNVVFLGINITGIAIWWRNPFVIFGG